MLLLGVLLISMAGILAVYSASQGYEQRYWMRQLLWLGLSFGAAFAVLSIDDRRIGRYAYVLHLLVLVALAGLLLGNQGVSRWYHIGGIAVQPSEIAKLTTILAVARWFREDRSEALGWFGLLPPFLFALIPFLLIMRQPDLGTALVLLLITLPLFFAAGLHARLIVFSAVCGGVLLLVTVASFQFGFYQIGEEELEFLGRYGRTQDAQVVNGSRFHLRTTMERSVGPILEVESRAEVLEQLSKRAFRPYVSYLLLPYQQQRLLSFVDPERDPLGSGYHVRQSKVALGSGRLVGKGFGKSTQGALNFLPARHTDFIFSIFAEEWGFIGALTIFLLYVLVVARCLLIALRAAERDRALTALGVALMFACQSLVNTGMAMGLLPVVGVSLPLFSYGGSSMLISMLGIALVLSVGMRRFQWK